MRFLVVGPSPLVLGALAALIERRFSNAAVSTTDCYDAATDILSQHPANLVVADTTYCGTREHQRLPDLVAAARPGRVVLFGRTDSAFARTMGAHGQIPASSNPELIGAAIGLVLAGGCYLPGSATGSASIATDRREPVKPLSPRVRSVLRGLQDGKSNRSIAEDLGLSTTTVKLHVKTILRRLGARNRTQAVVLAAKHAPEFD